jgi:hypothetical protein
MLLCLYKMYFVYHNLLRIRKLKTHEYQAIFDSTYLKTAEQAGLSEKENTW